MIAAQVVATTMGWFDRVDRQITGWMAAYGLTLLRVALAVESVVGSR